MKFYKFLLLSTLAMTFTVQAVEVSPVSSEISIVVHDVSSVLDATTDYLLDAVTAPTYGSVGGEWTVFGLARRGVDVPAGYYENYYAQIEQVAAEQDADKSRGWGTKVTDTQRLAIAVGAIGLDPTDVNGVDLLDYTFNKSANMPFLSQGDLGARQGLNELIFGLISIDLFDTPDRVDAENSRNSILSSIIYDYHNDDGGFALDKTSDNSSFDITAMAVQSLAKYYNIATALDATSLDAVTSLDEIGVFVDAADIINVVDESLAFLEQNLSSTGCEDLAQYIVALSALNLDATPVVELLLEFQLEDSSFEHIKGEGSNLMATEQAYYALVAYERFLLDQSALYDYVEVVADEN